MCDRLTRLAPSERVGFFAKFLCVALPFIHPSNCLPACLPSSLINIIRSFSQSNHRILYLLFISIADLPSSIYSPSLAHYRQTGGRAGEQA